MNHSHLHNPKYVGPGMWFAIHTLAAQARTDKEKKDVIHHIRCLQNKFPCAECKGHFGTYLASHPPEETIGKGSESLFAWTVNFHNAVNHRLKKPQLSYEEAKSIFLNDTIFCTADCDDKDSSNPKNSSNSSNQKDFVFSEKIKNDVKKNLKLVPSDIPIFLR